MRHDTTLVRPPQGDYYHGQLRAVDNGLGSIEERRLAGVTLAQLGREPDVRPSELRS
jgi:hypothetical protein